MQLPQRPIPEQTFDRASLITLLHTALKVSENRYARLFALGWLGAYPGDLEVRLLYARAMIQDPYWAARGIVTFRRSGSAEVELIMD